MDEISTKLFEKLLHNECSAAEVEEILAIMATAEGPSIYDDLILVQLAQKVDLNDFPADVQQRLNARFHNIIKEEEPSLLLSSNHTTLSHWLKLPAIAAAVIATISLGAIFYQQHLSVDKHLKVAAVHDIAPGKNDAVLTLADGRKIVLTEKANGQLAQQAGIKVSKAADGKLVYQIEDGKLLAANSAALYNTITTPKGGQYQVNLPDGTQVWLNSASSIKFPIVFSAAPTRKVELSGEGYFEVAKDKKHPFIVQTEKQTVQVLGTHFDISAYPEDASTKTTLLEGSVSISANHQTSLLKPGQQARVSEGIQIANVDTENAVAWKSGYFLFDDEELGSVMNKVARWYDLEVEFTDEKLKHELIAAYTTRFANVSQLLKRMNQMGHLHFELQDRTITISRKNNSK